ncbi:MAG: UDP-3-O-(3-hydroxymyristoyl)glucosamine N-acyltransferase [Ghiorsea sp.]
MPLPVALSLADVAALVAGKLEEGDAGKLIQGVQTLAKANGDQASFLSNAKYKDDLLTTRAGLVLLSHKSEVPSQAERDGQRASAVLRVADPYVAFTLLQQYFHPLPTSSAQRHASAAIHDLATIADNVQIDAQVSIAAGVSIGKGSIVGAGCVLADGVSGGEHCILHPRVVVEVGTRLGNRVIIQAGAVLGSDGFGFAWNGEKYLKIPQVGRVVVEDDVEIGANTCIDRGAIDDTIIRQGAKLDNLIQLAHNVEVGEQTVIAGQAGIAGSTLIGKGCQFGAQSGVAGHLKLVDGSVVGAKAGVIGDVKVAGMVSGFPAVPHRHWLKASALFDRLPTIWKKIKQIT